MTSLGVAPSRDQSTSGSSLLGDACPLRVDVARDSQSDMLSPRSHVCLLDVIHIELSDIDLFSARWQIKDTDGLPASHQRHAHRDSVQTTKSKSNLVFPSYVIVRQTGKLLKEKGRLVVQAERNLEGEVSHSVPDVRIAANLSSLHFNVDLQQFKLVKGLLFHNFGEELEPLQTKLVNFEDPKIQVCTRNTKHVSLTE